MGPIRPSAYGLWPTSQGTILRGGMFDVRRPCDLRTLCSVYGYCVCYHTNNSRITFLRNTIRLDIVARRICGRRNVHNRIKQSLFFLFLFLLLRVGERL